MNSQVLSDLYPEVPKAGDLFNRFSVDLKGVVTGCSARSGNSMRFVLIREL